LLELKQLQTTSKQQQQQQKLTEMGGPVIQNLPKLRKGDFIGKQLKYYIGEIKADLGKMGWEGNKAYNATALY